MQNGVRMVASVNSFLQEQVYYYEYKNLIFRGSEELGYENYGNGGRDPLEDENRDPRYKNLKEKKKEKKRKKRLSQRIAASTIDRTISIT